MNIKSLLLGSAAALVAVSGARAADAVVIAEPEPMEYVRICDVYGAGFFYIPGTETCLKFDGYFRYDLGFGENTGVDVDLAPTSTDVDFDGDGVVDGVIFNTNDDGSLEFNSTDGDDDTYYSRMRAAFRWDARSETELGTLRGYAHINFDYDRSSRRPEFQSPNNFTMNHAYIELAGFRIGKTDSLFSSITNYAGNVSNDGFRVGYGPFDTHVIAYTFTGTNGFSASIGVEDGAGFNSVDVIQDYVPHVVAGASWTQGWGGISGVAAYDSNNEEGAFKARVDVNATEQLSLFLMGGYSTSDEEGNAYAVWGGEWAVWGGGSFKVNDKASINVEVAYDDNDNFHAIANVDYELVTNFRIVPEVVYDDNFDADDEDSIGGFVRFQRNF